MFFYLIADLLSSICFKMMLKLGGFCVRLSGNGIYYIYSYYTTPAIKDRDDAAYDKPLIILTTEEYEKLITNKDLQIEILNKLNKDNSINN